MLVGVSESMLRRHEARGTIFAEPDGSWDVEKTKSRLESSQNPARADFDAVGVPRLSRGVKIQNEIAPSIADLTFNEARTANENLKVARNKIELAELEGRLIDRSAAIKAVRVFAQQDRDAILAWPARAAAVIAAEFGVDPHAMHASLSDSLRSHLSEQADIVLGS